MLSKQTEEPAGYGWGVSVNIVGNGLPQNTRTHILEDSTADCAWISFPGAPATVIYTAGRSLISQMKIRVVLYRNPIQLCVRWAWTLSNSMSWKLYGYEQRRTYSRQLCHSLNIQRQPQLVSSEQYASRETSDQWRWIRLTLSPVCWVRVGWGKDWWDTPILLGVDRGLCIYTMGNAISNAFFSQLQQGVR